MVLGIDYNIIKNVVQSCVDVTKAIEPSDW